jgi:cytochrome c553
MRRLFIITVGLLAMASLAELTMNIAHGQAPPRGDAKRGERIAAEGTQAGAPACVSCHGVEGNPDGSGTFPRLFGLARAYLAKQLRDYAAGRRSNDLMTQIAKGLSVQETADVAAYYAAAKEPLPSFPAGDKGLIIRGERLAAVGDQSKQVPACNNCHGPGGTGQRPLIPYLAGQFAPYMTQQLSLWQQGVRKNDGGKQMTTVTKRLSDHDFAAVAAYYQQVDTTAAPAAGQPATK